MLGFRVYLLTFLVHTKYCPYIGSHVIRKPVFVICKQQRRRSACAPAQSDQHLCYSLPRKCNTSFFYIRHFKPQASSLCDCAGRFESQWSRTLKTGFLVTRLLWYCSVLWFIPNYVLWFIPNYSCFQLKLNELDSVAYKLTPKTGFLMTRFLWYCNVLWFIPNYML